MNETTRNNDTENFVQTANTAFIEELRSKNEEYSTTKREFLMMSTDLIPAQAKLGRMDDKIKRMEMDKQMTPDMIKRGEERSACFSVRTGPEQVTEAQMIL